MQNISCLFLFILKEGRDWNERSNNLKLGFISSICNLCNMQATGFSLSRTAVQIIFCILLKVFCMICTAETIVGL